MYFETVKIKDEAGLPMTPAKDDSITLLKRIFQALKPLAMITGAGSNRLSVDVNNVTNVTTVATVTTVTTCTTVTGVTTVGTVTNQAQMAGITCFDLLKAMSRTAYNSGIRANLT